MGPCKGSNGRLRSHTKLAGEVNTLYIDLPESDHVKDMNKQTDWILDANSEKSDTYTYMQECNILNEKENVSLRPLLKKIRDFI